MRIEAAIFNFSTYQSHSTRSPCGSETLRLLTPLCWDVRFLVMDIQLHKSLIHFYVTTMILFYCYVASFYINTSDNKINHNKVGFRFFIISYFYHIRVGTCRGTQKKTIILQAKR